MRTNLLKLLFPGALLSVLLFTACSKTTVEELAETEPQASSEATSDLNSDPASEHAPKATSEGDGNALEVSAPQPAVTSSMASSSAANESTTDNTAATTYKDDPERTAPTAEEVAELARRNESAKTAITALGRKYKTATMVWQAKFRAAKTSQARVEIRKNGPREGFAKKYLELAQEFSGTSTASKALTYAIRLGSEETTKIASNELFEMVEMDAGTLESEGMLISIANFGDDESKLKAAQIMADLVTNDPDSDVGQRLAPQVLKLGDKSPGKTQVAQMILDLADQDVRSDKALDQLVDVASATTGDIKSAALSRISSHHLESKKIFDVIKTVSSRGMPDLATETWLKDVCLKSNSPTAQSSAAIALKRFIDKRDRFRSVLVGANKEMRGKELDLIETTLDGYIDGYIDGNEELLEDAKNQLFALKYLSIGKVAPEIAGADTDGVDFKLSDYRGKVVFLDFWGDW